MTAQKLTTYYLCCKKQKKAFLKRKLKSYYKNSYLLTDLLCECDRMIVIGKPDQIMEKEINQAKLSGIGIETLDEKILTQAQEKELLENNPEKESGFSSRNRIREYEL